MAINKFLGNSIISRLKETKFESIEAIRERLKPSTEIGLGTWNDISGLITPASEIDSLLNDIDNKKLTSLEEINERFKSIHKNYYEYEWTWALDKIEEKLGKKYTEFTVQDIIEIVNVWTKSVVDLDKLLYEDAKKEFDLISHTGFGADGDEETKAQDFYNVRGNFEENPFVKEVLRHIEVKTALGQELINRIEHLR
jgi:benzoyl-CoA reductase/2-hydroxyglutaryl-CoA dehydratase subunit BcrC/BadD/HgdB